MLGAGERPARPAGRRWRSGCASRGTPPRSRAAPGARRPASRARREERHPRPAQRVAIDRLQPGDLGVLAPRSAAPSRSAASPTRPAEARARPRRRREARWRRPSASSARSRGSRRCRRSGTPRRAPTLAPCSAATRAARTPPEPPPITKRSKSKSALTPGLTRPGCAWLRRCTSASARAAGAARPRPCRPAGRSAPARAMPMKSPCSTTPGIGVQRRRQRRADRRSGRDAGRGCGAPRR